MGALPVHRLARITLLALGLVALLWLFLAWPLAPVTLAIGSGVDILVTTPADEYDTSGSGTGCSLREAIQTSYFGTPYGGCARVANFTTFDTILLPSGTYTLTRAGADDANVTGDLDIRRNVVISATGATAPIVTGDPSWTDRLFDILTGTVSMKGLAIRNEDLTSGGGSGGALHVAPGASLSLVDSVVADSHSDGDGGGIYNQGTLMLLNVSLSHNNAGFFGGGISNDHGVMTLSNVILSDNSAVLGGGVHNSGRATLTNTTIFSNVATTSGGMSNIGTATLISSTVNRNQIFSGTTNVNDGAPCLFTSGTLLLDNVTLSDCHAVWGDGRGGALWVGLGGSATLLNSRVLSNSAAIGGGIFSRGALSVTTSYFAHNSASQGYLTGVSGGAMWLSGTANIVSSTFYSNTANEDGGAIGNSEGVLNVSNASFSENWALDGGALSNNNGKTTLFNSSLVGNSAVSNGGGIFVYGGSVDLFYATFSLNSAQFNGGGINNQGALNLFGSTLSLNSAQNSGGGIYNTGEATLDEATLSRNVAGQQGGGILNGYTAMLKASTLVSNSAGLGGGIYNWTGTSNLTNVTLSGNSAIQGGGVYNQAGTAGLLNVTLSANSASASGGALFMESGYTTVLTNSIIAYSASGGNCSGGITLSTSSLSSDNTCALPAGNTIHGQNPNGLDPLLTALGNYGGPTLVHMLRSGSPAIDGVVGSDAPANDQRGVSRPQGGGYDIGAVEYAAVKNLRVATSSPALVGNPVYFTATISAGDQVTYTWNFGDGTIISAPNAPALPTAGPSATHAYARPGMFTAVVTATNSVNALAATSRVSVTAPVYLPLIVR